MKNIIIIGTSLLIIGCHSTPRQSANNSPVVSVSNEQAVRPLSPPGEQSVRYASKVKVAIYDSTSRKPTTKLIVFRQAPTRSYHTIASLTISGTAEKEADLMNAIGWKARQLGADSIIVVTPLHPHRDEWIFRADAIELDVEKPN